MLHDNVPQRLYGSVVLSGIPCRTDSVTVGRIGTAVTLLKDAGIPEAVVMEMIGHDSEQMSAHYTHVGREALEKAAAALPEIFRNLVR